MREKHERHQEKLAKHWEKHQRRHHEASAGPSGRQEQLIDEPVPAHLYMAE